MEKIKKFTDLEAWKQGHKLVLMIYKSTENFPNKEQFGLISQLRRAVISVTSNIAEGFSRKTSKDKINFYYTALASLTEIQNQLLIARDVNYMTQENFIKTADQTVYVQKLIHGLIKYLKNN